jgi:hypothetical protein
LSNPDGGSTATGPAGNIGLAADMLIGQMTGLGCPLTD